jgi:ABC-type multidrug transport system fused ATPase/permease subunit
MESFGRWHFIGNVVMTSAEVVVAGWLRLQASGQGKSTVISLLQRFYDASSGTVMIGDRDLTSLDLAWWRQSVLVFIA